VYRGKDLPNLYGKYVLGDIVSGRLFYVEESELNFSSLAQISEFNISIDGELTSLARLIGGGRVDLRLGWDADGELYVFGKGQGVVYKAIGSELIQEGKDLALQSIDRQMIQHTLEVDPIHAIVASGENALIDNMEDGDLDLLELEGREGSWTALNFESNGTDPIQIVELGETPGNGSQLLQISGNRAGRESPMVLFSLVGELEAENTVHYDASVYDGIQFWVKGNQGGRMSFKIHTAYTVPILNRGLYDANGYDCWNEYECRVNVEDDWSLIRLPFTRFLQSGLPNDDPLNPSILKTIGFSLRSRSGTVFWLDDISFYVDN